MAGVDLDLVARLERSMLTSWPALSMAFDGEWVIRLADGVTKRANAVTCLSADDHDLDRRIDRIETIYGDRDLPAIFRLSPLASSALDLRLNERGWRRFDETIVMIGDLEEVCARLDGNAHHDVTIDRKPTEAWLRNCYRIDDSTPAHLATLTAMLNRLVPKAGYGRIGGNDPIDALALLVIDAELAGLFEVLTIKERRRQGLARALLGTLFSWSRTEGATTAWLPVVADNLPAIGLYQKLGFREVYRYHYRAKG